MNIFYLHNDPQVCAAYHCDKHVVKMILEYAQLLSTAHHELDGVPSIECYKKTHVNHPCTKWVRESLQNYRWLMRLITGLNDEYRKRYNKDVNHKSFDAVRDLPEPDLLPQFCIRLDLQPSGYDPGVHDLLYL